IPKDLRMRTRRSIGAPGHVAERVESKLQRFHRVKTRRARNHSSFHFMADRDIDRIVTTAPPEPGFIGEGHTAVMVVNPAEFPQNDPFIALMDDRIDLAPGARAGG